MLEMRDVRGKTYPGGQDQNGMRAVGYLLSQDVAKAARSGDRDPHRRLLVLFLGSHVVPLWLSLARGPKGRIDIKNLTWSVKTLKLRTTV